jgi:hypothetical protein
MGLEELFQTYKTGNFQENWDDMDHWMRKNLELFLSHADTLRTDRWQHSAPSSTINNTPSHIILPLCQLNPASLSRTVAKQKPRLEQQNEHHSR